MTVSANATGIDVTPDPSKLGQGTGPWYLDPGVQVPGNSQESVNVQEYFPKSKNADNGKPVGTGYCGYDQSYPYPCPDINHGRERAYYRVGVDQRIWGSTIISAQLQLQVADASAPGTSTPMGLYSTGAIDRDTRWEAQPCDVNSTMGGCTKIGIAWMDAPGPLYYSVTAQMASAASGRWNDFTFGLAPDDETNKAYRHHFANNPQIIVTYDITPTLWWERTNSATGQAPGFASDNTHVECSPGGSNIAWLGANQNVSLVVSHGSATGLPMATNFYIWDQNGASRSLSVAPNSDANNAVTIGSDFLHDGGTYGWYANTSDGQLSSGNSSPCFFRIDMTPPNASISSTDFPPSGTPAPANLHYASDSGTFTLGGSDPAPAGGGASSGLACFRVSTDSTPVTGWHCGDPGTVTADSTGHASFQHVPGLWGTNILYAQAQDNAGNYSQPAAYSYYAPWKPGTPPVFGDVDGDMKADILLPDTSGNLRFVSNSNDPTRAISASAASAPGNDQNHHVTWNDFQITHRGALETGLPVDQLIVHNTTYSDLKKYLYLVYNDGHGHFDSKPATPLTRPANCVLTLGGTPGPCPSDYGPDWSNITQLVAIGTPEGEATAADPKNPGKQLLMTRTSLLTVENGKLWLFRPSDTFPDQLSGTAQLIPTTTGGSWDNYDVIGPGPANGNNQATVWARNRTDGTIHAYPITFDSQGNLDYSKLQDPTGGRIPYAQTFNPADFPLVGSSGDINGDGMPDLWSISNTKQLQVFPGYTSGTNTPVAGFNWPANLGTVNTTISPVLSGGTILHSGDAAYSAHTRLVMQADGNLVLYSLNTGSPLWSSRTNNHPGAWATMQTDGNLVVYLPKTDANGNPTFPSPGSPADALWSSGTAGSGAWATVQDDCNFAIYNTSWKMVWNSNTYNPNP
ncbi:hypothetical protein [Kitasatospora kifunensis]|uniref:Bulb-type lectin domain-containing protein n=1 Tax=Kitasatospora kifunensis TaxID=58351 RepID=A0A7W7R052_KITKI|nr:hypothetical protein [Kitasatospora kifunensis]MBB4922718.1 hypothetical protein [Kitasatospora kifunensis]